MNSFADFGGSGEHAGSRCVLTNGKEKEAMRRYSMEGVKRR